ncbi:MAG: hypothetical protein ACE5IQ_11465 [Candidatus Methylomirabilales bacterium]
MNHPFRGKAGLTIVEVLLAAVIIMVAVLGIVGLFPTALQNVRYGGHMSQASSLAQEMIEMIRTQPFAAVFSYNGLDTRNPAPGALPASVLSHFARWQSDIAPANPGGALPQGWGTIQVVENALGLADLKQVTITVGWQERGPQVLTLDTYVARK